MRATARAKTIPGPRTLTQPGRWAAWARALAGRFRERRTRGMGADLVLHRLAERQSAGVVERIVERTLVTNKLFAPRLHLTISPILRSILRSTVTPGGTAGPAGRGETRPGVVARTVAHPWGAPARVGALAQSGALARSGVLARVPLERAWARCNAPAAFPPGLSLTLVRTGRDLPRASSGELLALAGRVAARGQRQEAPFRRPATALHPPSPPAPPSEAAAEVSERPRRRGPRGSPAASPAFPAGAPGVFMGTPGELDRLTEQVVRRIDRRMDAWRERTGRVR